MNRPFNRRIIRTGPAVAYGVAGVAGVFAAMFAMLATMVPMRLVEAASFYLYLDKIVAAAAPPLGSTARILVIALFATIGWFIGRAIGRRFDVTDSGYRINFHTIINKLRGVGREDDPDAPTLRAEDRHPDAPARRPFSVKRDVPKRDWDLAPSRLPKLRQNEAAIEEEDELVLDTNFAQTGFATSPGAAASPATANPSAAASSESPTESTSSGESRQLADSHDRFGIRTTGEPDGRNRPDYYAPVAMPAPAPTRRGVTRGAPIYPDREMAPRPDALSVTDLYPAHVPMDEVLHDAANSQDKAQSVTPPSPVIPPHPAEDENALPAVSAFMGAESQTDGVVEPTNTPPIAPTPTPVAAATIPPLPGSPFSDHSLFAEPDPLAPGFRSLDPPLPTQFSTQHGQNAAMSADDVQDDTPLELTASVADDANAPLVLTPPDVPVVAEETVEVVVETDVVSSAIAAPVVETVMPQPSEPVAAAPTVNTDDALAQQAAAVPPVVHPAARVEPEPLDLSVARLDDLLARLETGMSRRRQLDAPANDQAVMPVANDMVPPTPRAEPPRSVDARTHVPDPDFVVPEDPALAAALATLRRMRQHVG